MVESRIRWWRCLTGVLSVCLIGCGGEKASQTLPPNEDVSRTTKQSEFKTVAADVAVRNLLANFRNDPHLLWDALPADYQDSLNKQQSEFLSRVEAQSFDEFVELLKHCRIALAARRASILAEQNEYLVPGIGIVSEKQYDYLLNVLDSVSPQAIGSWQQVQTKSVNEMWNPLLVALLTELPEFEDLEQPLLVQYAKRMEGVQVTLKSQVDGRATVQLLDPDAPEEPAEFEFILKQGKWVPITWDQQWPKWMAKTKLKLDNIAAVLNQAKQSNSSLLSRLEQQLALLERAKDKQQFQEAWSDTLAPLSVWGVRLLPNKNMPQVQREPLESINLNSSVRVIVSRLLTANELEQLSVQVLGLSEYPEVAVLLPVESEGEQTCFRLAPAPNVQAIADQIKFGKVQEVDVEGRRIVVELPEKQ